MKGQIFLFLTIKITYFIKSYPFKDSFQLRFDKTFLKGKHPILEAFIAASFRLIFLKLKVHEANDNALETLKKDVFSLAGIRI